MRDLPSLRIAVLDDYQNVARTMVPWDEALEGAAVAFFHDWIPDEDALVARLAGFDVVVAMRERTRFPRSVLDRLPDLELLVSTGMRNAAIDLDAAEAAGIVVCGTGSSPSGPVELTWALILGLARRIPMEDDAVRRGFWQTGVGTALHGRTLGIVGLGRIGTKVGEIGRAFGMEVLAWSPRLTAERALAGGAELRPKERLFTDADVISVHMVLSEATRLLIGEPELRSMKPSALLINTSRGPIVDAAALARALEEGWIGGAALDVYDREPLPKDDPLRRRSTRCILTPHIGYVTDASYRIFFDGVIEAIQAFAAGAPIRRLAGSQ